MNVRALVPLAFAAAPLASAQEEPTPMPLPDDPKAVVLSLDFAGGFTPPRRTKEPFLRILADGTAIAPPLFEAGEPRSIRLAPQELQALLRFVVDEQRIFEWDADAVARALREQEMPMVADASTTVVRVRLAKRSIEARQEALGMFVSEDAGLGIEPVKIPALQRLHAVEQRLQHWHAIVLAGGRERVTAHLEALNAARAKESETIPAFAAEDLRGALFRGDGITLRFDRRVPEGQWLASVGVSAAGERTFQFHWIPSR